MKVFSTYHLPADLKYHFKQHNIVYSENPYDRSLTTDELISLTKDADGNITLLSDNISRKVISSLSKCKIIANYAVGYNNIDLVAAHEHSIVVTNTPGILTDATAKITFALILACARKKSKRRGRSDRENLQDGNQILFGKRTGPQKYGIIGAGRIAQAVAKIANGFNMLPFTTPATKKLKWNPILMLFISIFLNL